MFASIKKSFKTTRSKVYVILLLGVILSNLLEIQAINEQTRHLEETKEILKNIKI